MTVTLWFVYADFPKSWIVSTRSSKNEALTAGSNKEETEIGRGEGIGKEGSCVVGEENRFTSSRVIGLFKSSTEDAT